MDITRMIQLSLGVPDAIPEGRRPEIAAKRLVLVARERGMNPEQSTPRDEGPIYEEIVSTAFDALVGWAQANPRLDDLSTSRVSRRCAV